MKPQDGAEQPKSTEEQQQAANDQEACFKGRRLLLRKQTGLRFV